ncbi:hypothetical protein KIPB_001281 [Kipferlia bialata]|uniref:B30.2/SPRY domain-containing protein n=1 Tax=Kipferlia bialata TaxID=797122 RepID=A0A9K3CPV8_9EUKA|nr:hypothetical protein KIPB_001281 [Kipferlia bialata]|eukprot:g1281.t1
MDSFYGGGLLFKGAPITLGLSIATLALSVFPGVFRCVSLLMFLPDSMASQPWRWATAPFVSPHPATLLLIGVLWLRGAALERLCGSRLILMSLQQSAADIDVIAAECSDEIELEERLLKLKESMDQQDSETGEYGDEGLNAFGEVAPEDEDREVSESASFNFDGFEAVAKQPATPTQNRAASPAGDMMSSGNLNSTHPPRIKIETPAFPETDDEGERKGKSSQWSQEAVTPKTLFCDRDDTSTQALQSARAGQRRRERAFPEVSLRETSRGGSLRTTRRRKTITRPAMWDADGDQQSSKQTRERERVHLEKWSRQVPLGVSERERERQERERAEVEKALEMERFRGGSVPLLLTVHKMDSSPSKGKGLDARGSVGERERERDRERERTVSREDRDTQSLRGSRRSARHRKGMSSRPALEKSSDSSSDERDREYSRVSHRSSRRRSSRGSSHRSYRSRKHRRHRHRHHHHSDSSSEDSGPAPLPANCVTMDQFNTLVQSIQTLTTEFTSYRSTMEDRVSKMTKEVESRVQFLAKQLVEMRGEYTSKVEAVVTQIEEIKENGSEREKERSRDRERERERSVSPSSDSESDRERERERERERKREREREKKRGRESTRGRGRESSRRGREKEREITLKRPEYAYNPQMCHPDIKLGNENTIAQRQDGDSGWHGVHIGEEWSKGINTITFKIERLASNGGIMIGICKPDGPVEGIFHQKDTCALFNDGHKAKGNKMQKYDTGKPFTQGDLVSLIANMDKRSLGFFVNGEYLHTAFERIPRTVVPYMEIWAPGDAVSVVPTPENLLSGM